MTLLLFNGTAPHFSPALWRMVMRNLIAAAALASVAVTACASMPPVTVQYYPTTGSTEVTVLETLTCTPDRKKVVAVYALDQTTRYFAATDASPREIEIRGIIPPWGDGSTGFTFHEDGRLKGINSTATGRGEEVIKAGVGVISAAVTGGLLTVPGLMSDPGLASDPDLLGRPRQTNPCDRILGADGKGALTIQHTAVMPHAPFVHGEVQLQLAPRDAAMRAPVAHLLPTLRLEATAPRRIAPAAVYAAQGAPDLVPVPLNHTAAVNLVLTTVGEPDQHTRITKPIIIAENETYDVPLPRAAPFGERSVQLTLADSGAITALTYGTKSGIAGAANGGATIVGFLGEDSATAQAAEIKGEADLIAQLQRLARCRADPASCI